MLAELILLIAAGCAPPLLEEVNGCESVAWGGNVIFLVRHFLDDAAWG